MYLINSVVWYCFDPRSHTYQFDDFLASWMDRLKDGLDGEHTTVTVRLQKEVDKYQVILWYLNYLVTYAVYIPRLHTVCVYVNSKRYTHLFLVTLQMSFKVIFLLFKIDFDVHAYICVIRR